MLKATTNTSRLIRVLRLPLVATLIASTLLSLMQGGPASAAANITATKTDALLTDADSSGNVTAGDTLRYTVTIQNTGDQDATNAVFNDTIDNNTAFVPGSLQTTPLARNDSGYSTVGNVNLTVPVGSSVLLNDNDPDGSGGISVSSYNPTSTNGGQVAMAVDGSFTYNPPPGFSGTDTFTYTATDGEANNNSATVSITVGPVVWFINNAVGGPGDGRFTSPFNSVANFNALAADDPGDYIFVYQGAGAYSSAFTLLNNQQLIGHGVGLSISPNLAIAAASRPTIANVTLGSGNTVRGLNVSASSGTGISGASVGSLTINNASVTNSAGGGVSLGNGTLAVTLDSVSSNGGANGIALNTTSGSFTVTGDNGGSANGSGGTIQNSTGPAVLLSSANNVSLGYMNIQNSQDDGIRGTTVNGFTLNRSLVSGNGNAVGESGLDFDGLFGVASITNSTVTGSRAHNVLISNMSGTLNSLTITGSTFSSNHATDGLDGVSVTLPAGSTGTITTITATGNAFTNNRTDGMGVNAEGSSSIGIFNFANNTLTGNDIGVNVSTNGTASIDFDIHNNATMTGTRTQVNIAANDGIVNNGVGPTMEGYIRNNTITTSPTGSSFIALWVVSEGDGNITVDINNNNVTNFGDSGIDVESRGGTGDINARIANNTATTTATFPFTGMFLRSGNGTVGETNLLCVNLSGNDINAGSAFNDYELDRFNSPNTLFQIQGLSPSPATGAQAAAFVASLDAGSTAGAVGGVYTNVTCATVSFAPLPLLAAGGEGPGAPGAQVSQAQLDAVATAAIERWVAAGLSATELATLHTVTVQVADLEAGHLGGTLGTLVELDRDAAGWGWYVDATPGGDDEFAGQVAATERRAEQGSPADGRMDLLTVVMHELGHVLGHGDTPLADAPHALMAEELPTGVRRTPAASAAQAPAAAPSSVTTTPTSVQANVGTLPAAKRVVVTFDVVINNPVPAGVSQVSNQARITASALAPVLSDDPAAAGAANPTITMLDVVKKVYLPMLTRPGEADLVVTSVTLSPNKTSFRAGEPVVITVVIRNQGSAAAAPFWVDMYLNPSRQPGFNVIWNTVCTLNPCFGIGWPVTGGLAPGASVTLTSAVVPPGYSVWPGYFAAGTTDLYVLADSYNPTGPMVDSSRANNLFHLPGLQVTGPNPTFSSAQSLEQRPARP